MDRLRRISDETFRSLRSRNFRLFFIGQGTSQIGNWMTLVVQSLLVLQLTDSGVAVGIMAAAQFAPVLVLGAWAGLVADRSDKRRLLMVVQTAAMLQSFALAALAFMDEPPLLPLYGVALIGGVTLAFDNPARRAFVVETVPESDVNNAVSLNSAQMTASRMIGPALAGVLITTVGFGWAFAIDGLSYIAVLIALAMMRPRDLRRPPVASRGKGQVRQGLRYARSVPEIWMPLVMMAIVGTLAFNFQVVFPLFVIRDFGSTDMVFTILFSTISAGSLVGALVSARRRTVSISVVARSSLALGASLAAIAVAPNLFVAFPIGIVVGFAAIAYLTASTSIVQLRSDPSMRGRVLALQAIVFLGTTPIGGPIVGAIAERFGARYAIGVGAVAAMAAGAWGLVRDRGRPPILIDAPQAAASVREAEDDLDHRPSLRS